MKKYATLPLLTALLLAPLAALHAADAPKPNIIFLLADDLGWGDLGCYGHPHIRTPNLDALAADGRLYTSFYANGPVCSPTRAAFMTGQFPSRLRVFGALGEDGSEKGNAKYVDPAVPNMARILKQQGYATGHFGKWHLDAITDPEAPPISQYGFDESRAHVATGPSFDELEKQLPRGVAKNARSSEWIVDASLDFLERHKQGPVFLNIWFMVPHASLLPSKEQREGYKKFWSHGKLHDVLLEKKGIGADISTPQEMYYPSVTEMDAQIGRLIQKLKEMGTYENTILIFSSDNGPESIHIAKAMHSGVGSPGVFRGQKRSLYDGGIRVPFIISWPKGGIPRGTVDRELPVSGVDLLPSLLGLTVVPQPPELKGDGEDLSAAFRGQPFSRKKALFWEQRGGQTGYPLQFSPRLAMREGPWKLLMNPDGSRLELYDLQKQMMETDNLASEFPEVAQRMKASLEDWRKTLPEPDEYFSDMKTSGWEALLSGGKMPKAKNSEAKRKKPSR